MDPQQQAAAIQRYKETVGQIRRQILLVMVPIVICIVVASFLFQVNMTLAFVIMFGGVFVVMGAFVASVIGKALPQIREERKRLKQIQQQQPKPKGPMNKTMKIFIIIMICLIVFVVIAVIVALNYFNSTFNSEY